jgi:predicted signal transduction protein with EAL and GGDEF domain
VDILKIDRSFIERMHYSNDAALVRTIIALGKLLSLRTVPRASRTRSNGTAPRAGMTLPRVLFGRPMDARAIDTLLDSIPVAAPARPRAPRRKRTGRAR